MARPGFSRQLSILVERNLAIQFGSFSTLMLLFIQPPLIGYFIGLAWKSQEAKTATYFIMAVAAIWMGCMNASCVIVRERAIFNRERMFNLNVWSYLFSKLIVLGVISGLQSVLLLVVQAQLMHIPRDFMVHALFFLILTVTGISASGLGLAISSFARTSYAAAITVPILLIPQVIFSEVLLGGNIDRDIPATIEKCTLTKWSFEALKVVVDDRDWGTIFQSFFMLALGLSIFTLVAAVKLKWDDS